MYLQMHLQRLSAICLQLEAGKPTGAMSYLVFLVLLLWILHTCTCLVFIALMMYSCPGKYIHEQIPIIILEHSARYLPVHSNW